MGKQDGARRREAEYAIMRAEQVRNDHGIATSKGYNIDATFEKYEGERICGPDY